MVLYGGGGGDVTVTLILQEKIGNIFYFKWKMFL